jgi:DNA-binding SARP family transcriptional activator
VPADRLVDQLWPEEPPPQPMVSLRSYVSNLRRLLKEPGGGSVIVTRSGGYLLDLAPERIDAHRFEHTVREARAALAAGDPADALVLLTEALSLWRGDPLADIAGEAHARPTIARLEELRLSAMEDRFDALLALGEHVEVVPELEAFTRQHPARERPTRQLMLALYRSARTPEALEVAARFRAPWWTSTAWTRARRCEPDRPHPAAGPHLDPQPAATDRSTPPPASDATGSRPAPAR